MKHPILITLVLLLTTSASSIAQIYSSGSCTNSIGTGAGGANESVLQTTTFGMSTIGFGQQSASFNRIADDFTVDCEWTIDSVYLYGYQTGSTTTSTFTGYNIRIWDGVPDAVGSNVVFGDTTTNRMIRSVWSGTYRVTQTTIGGSTRPIMRNTIQLGVTLPAGTYYFDWAATGSLASGPWQVPITIMGQNITGNGRQRIGSTWNNLVDGGTGTPAQGVPFDIFGTMVTVTADAGADATVCENGTIALGGSPTGTSSEASPLTYSWSNVPAADSTLSNPTVTIPGNMQFTVMITDTNGCVATDTIQVAAVAATPVTISSASNFMMCPESSTVLVADQNTSLLWSTSESNDSIVVNAEGSYSVLYIDGNGCTATDTVQVVAYAVTPVMISPANPGFCPGDGAYLVADQTSNVLWSTAEIDDSIYVNTPGTFYVHHTDANGCLTADTVNVVEFIPPTISAPNDMSICSGDTITLIASGGIDYVWDGTYPNGTEANPTQTTTYSVLGEDANGCTNTDAFTVTVLQPTSGTTTVNGVDSVQVNGVMYYQDGTYTQTLTNAAGCDSILTVEVQLEFTSIQEWDASVTVSPNPMKDFLNIKVIGTEERNFKLITIMGQVISEFTVSGSKTLDVSHLANGSYFIVDESNEQKLLLIKN